MTFNLDIAWTISGSCLKVEVIGQVYGHRRKKALSNCWDGRPWWSENKYYKIKSGLNSEEVTLQLVKSKCIRCYCMD